MELRCTHSLSLHIYYFCSNCRAYLLISLWPKPPSCQLLFSSSCLHFCRFTFTSHTWLWSVFPQLSFWTVAALWCWWAFFWLLSSDLWDDTKFLFWLTEPKGTDRNDVHRDSCFQALNKTRTTTQCGAGKLFLQHNVTSCCKTHVQDGTNIHTRN